MRSCLVGNALARKLDLPEAEVADAFYATLLLHVGCTALAHETVTAFGTNELVTLGVVAKTNVNDPREVMTKVIPEATRGMRPLSRARAATAMAVKGQAFGRMFDTGSCEVGSATARRIGLRDGVQRTLYELPEWWKGGGPPRGLKGDEIAIAARVARVASVVARFDELGGEELAVEALRRQSGDALDPSVVETFAESAGELLAEANAGDPRERIVEAEPQPVVECDEHELVGIVAAFGDLADLKTPWLHGHSGEVARLATAAARDLRLDAQAVSRLEVAAHLHDLGRVAVSNLIWEKPGPLSTAEWEQVRMHAYHSERILAGSRALQPMAPIAGMHHERLDGSGYHRGCRARELPPPARILAAADAYQAMTQDRPHRAALRPEQAGEELLREARAGRLDSDCVAAVLSAAGQRRPRRADLRPAGLSEREIEVVRLVADGCSNPEVARRLVISRRTAEHHVQHVYAKLGVSSRAAVALFAHEHDLIAPAGMS
jgi:HD-GYP domain-containing protein (c-di-GMP phosphodiesterase class II)